VEIAATRFGECEITMDVSKWLNVEMSEKPDVVTVCVAPAPNSSFSVNRLCKDFATVVHSAVRRLS
jgi:hypothetical protein